MTRTAIYAGSFDPLTLGHMDIITRGARLFDRLIVAVAVNIGKNSLFSGEERARFLRECVNGMNGVEILCMEGLLVNFARQMNATTILRGLRAVSDFEYEFQMAAMNRKLAPEVETVFLMSGESTTFVSSRLVKEIAAMGGDLSAFVPPSVIPALLSTMAGRGSLK